MIRQTKRKCCISSTSKLSSIRSDRFEKMLLMIAQREKTSKCVHLHLWIQVTRAIGSSHSIETRCLSNSLINQGLSNHRNARKSHIQIKSMTLVSCCSVRMKVLNFEITRKQERHAEMVGEYMKKMGKRKYCQNLNPTLWNLLCL